MHFWKKENLIFQNILNFPDILAISQFVKKKVGVINLIVDMIGQII